MHTITPLDKEAKFILTKIYKDAFFLSTKRKAYYENHRFVDWAIDLRYTLSKSRFLGPLTDEILKILDRQKITQIMGRGYGSFFMIGAIIAKRPNLRGGLIRESRKPNGFRQIIEGDLRRNQRTLIIDDIFSTGESMLRTIKILREEKIKICAGLVVFRFGWKEFYRMPKQFIVTSLAVLDYKPAYRHIYFSNKRSKIRSQSIQSPRDCVTFDNGANKIKVEYGRPYLRGRLVFGSVVPYGSLWRTGADDKTLITFKQGVRMGTVVVPKGTYSLYSIPWKKKWKLILSKDLESWPSNPDRSQDFAQIEMQVRKLTRRQEQFTIEVTKNENRDFLELTWDTTKAFVEFKTMMTKSDPKGGSDNYRKGGSDVAK